MGTLRFLILIAPAQLSAIPFIGKLAGFKVADSSVYQKGQQLMDDLKEKYETSDHPAVHKV